MIELKHVSKCFGSKVAVDDVSLQVEDGQCYGLIGPNAAGKTTIFSMLCGFLAPTEGRISIDGVNPTQPGVIKGIVGILPQDALLPPAWPVGELLTYYARLSDLPRPREEAFAALERMQLAEAWNLKVASLSHGMAKRVAMAQAFMGNPRVILLDEPAAGLDPKIAAAVRDIIRNIKGRHTIIISSHNLQEIEELCDATAILDRGKLLASATMTEMTSAIAEFRVQIAKGVVPLDEVRAQSGCRNAQLEPNNILCVHFDGQGTQAENLITQVVSLLIQHNVLILSVWRGKRLESRVLQLMT